MSINRFNQEGYYDPTMHEALTNVVKDEKKIIFICSPFAGDIERNTLRARRYGRFAAMKKAVPIIPHLMYPQFLEEKDPDERRMGLEMGLVLLSKCKELWVFGDKISPGMATEISRAKRWRIPIRYFTIRCEEKGGEQ